MRASSRSTLRRWDAEDDANHPDNNIFLSTSDLFTTQQHLPRYPIQSRRPMSRWPPHRYIVYFKFFRLMLLLLVIFAPAMETQASIGFTDWPFDGSSDSRVPPSTSFMDIREVRSRTVKRAAAHGFRAPSSVSGDFEGSQFDSDHSDGLQSSEDYKTVRAFRMDYEMEPRHSQVQLQRSYQQIQYQQSMQQEFGGDSLTSQLHRRTPNHPAEHGFYARETRAREPLCDMPFEPPRRISRNMLDPGSSSFGSRSNDLVRDVRAREMQNRRYNAFDPSFTRSSRFGPPIDEMPLEPATLDMYPDEDESYYTATASMSRQREYAQASVPSRQRVHHQMLRRPQYDERLTDDEMVITGRRSFQDSDLPRDRRETADQALYEDLVPTPTCAALSRSNDYGNVLPTGAGGGIVDLPSSRQRSSQSIMRLQKTKRQRPYNPPIHNLAEKPEQQASKAKRAIAKTPASASTASSLSEKDGEDQCKRRCGRKSMNYSSEQKRERNRAAVKKCRQRQALKLEYLQHKAESLAAENQALSEMLVKNTELNEGQRVSLKRGIQMDILLKIKEIFTQSLPKDFVLDADSIWDLNSVLAVSMPSRCYYGIESIKDFWRTSLRMRNKGKIRSFWAWLFRLPPGDRFSEFEIHSFSPISNLYFISWTTKSTPPLTGTMAIMFGNGHRVTLHVECFGWLIWRYLLTNKPFPEPSIE
ncbi:hypothetical protein DD238_005300 [Peronospora effusa]|uniref:BZIP domain-containing protein n=1 Tax=Peronospora effusa TaxID=542832 RepID=A0A3M6VPB5_9STRA|nr:hypothetical protein DD238_005300 [Peronospora effusa]